MNDRTYKFVPLAKHFADLKSQHLTAKALNSILNGQIKVGTKADIHFSDSNMQIELPQFVQQPDMFPFKIYQIDNVTDASLSANTFQIRDGLIGFRTNYNIASFEYLQGNWELPLLASGTDAASGGEPPWAYNNAEGAFIPFDFAQQPTPNTGGNVTLDVSGYPTLIFDNAQSTFIAGGVQVVSPATTPSWSASFYLIILDDPVNGPHVQLWGKYAPDGNFVGNPFYSTIEFGVNDNFNQTIALGFIFFIEGNSDPIISQAQIGHLLNRYLELPPFPALPVPTENGLPKFGYIAQVNRGYWTLNGMAQTVANYGSIAMYPGDVVVDDTNVITLDGQNFYWSYIYILQDPNLETLSPSNNLDRWKTYQLVSQ